MRALSFLFALSCLLVCHSVQATENWLITYRNSTSPHFDVADSAVDVDSVEVIGELVKYRYRFPKYGGGYTEGTAAANCKDRTRGDWSDLRMYPTYPNTKNGYEVQAVCLQVQQLGMQSKDATGKTQGSLAYPDGTYVGEFKDDKRTGQGTFSFANGNNYVGEFRDDRANGQGTLSWADGSRYVGEFKDDKRTGQGTLSWANGNRYVGEFKDDKRTGQGTFSNANGNNYVGEFRDDRANGQGTLSWADGSRYVGEFKDDKRTGQGTLSWANGNNYVGEFRDDRANGQGTYSWANGNRYVGEFKDDKRTGQGTFSFPDGRQYTGEWEDNEFNGRGTYAFSNGDRYVGDFKHGKFDGHGALFGKADGREYIGEFKDGKFVNRGTTAPAPTLDPKPVQPAQPPQARPASPKSGQGAARLDSTGSGFLVSRDRVVTNHHVVEGCTRLLIRFGDDVSQARLVAATTRNDLALLSTSRALGAPASLRAKAALGEDVTVAGYPLSGLLSNDVIVTSGQVNSLAGLGNDPTRLQISAPVQPGNSGGPLVDRSGSVVGVVVSKLNAERLSKVTGDMAQNINFAIKPEVLRLFLDTNRVQYRTTPLGQRVDGIQLAERARQFTVQVLCEK